MDFRYKKNDKIPAIPHLPIYAYIFTFALLELVKKFRSQTKQFYGINKSITHHLLTHHSQPNCLKPCSASPSSSLTTSASLTLSASLTPTLFNLRHRLKLHPRHLPNQRDRRECCPCSWGTPVNQLMNARSIIILSYHKTIPSSSISSSPSSS